MPYANPAEVERYLRDVNYPVSKQDLIKHAQQQGASNDVIEVLRNMRDQQFNTSMDVNKAVGEIDRQQKTGQSHLNLGNSLASHESKQAYQP